MQYKTRNVQSIQDRNTEIRSTRIEDRNFKEGRSGRRLPGVGSLNARPVRGEGGEGSERARELGEQGSKGSKGGRGARERASE
jgi:hypothetical protein